MKHDRNGRIPRPLVAAAVLTLAACGSDATGPTMESVAGSYGASEFTVTTAEGTTDVRGDGGHLILHLTANGTVTGELFAPGRDEGGADLDQEMDGTWSLDGDIVRFEQEADTFVRDMPFTVDGDALIGEATFGGETVRVVLRKVSMPD